MSSIHSQTARIVLEFSQQGLRFSGRHALTRRMLTSPRSKLVHTFSYSLVSNLVNSFSGNCVSSRLNFRKILLILEICEVVDVKYLPRVTNLRDKQDRSNEIKMQSLCIVCGIRVYRDQYC